jgi:hypothetical protein
MPPCKRHRPYPSPTPPAPPPDPGAPARQSPPCTILHSPLAAGRSVVPIAPGSKTPSGIDPRTGRVHRIPWKRYQDTPATAAEVRRWFAGAPAMGLGIVAGPASGVTLDDGRRAGLEFLDFDDPEAHERFVTRLLAQGGQALLERLPCEETPTGGRHYGYLCVKSGARLTLARRRGGTTRHDRTTMVPTIELRGRGSLCVVAPTPPGVHPDHPARGYVMVRGSWTAIPLITPEARRCLLDCARTLHVAAPRRHGHAGAGGNREDHQQPGVPPPPPVANHAGKQVRAYALTCFPVTQAGGQEFLRTLVRRPDVALACAAVLGLPTTPMGQGFLCILPGHAEAHLSASLHWDPKTGALQYRDWHARDDVPWYTLADVRASLAHRKAVRLRGPSVATWQLRLLVEAGLLAPYPVPARGLPPAAPPAARAVYEGFRFLLACKWWHTPQAPAPFAWRFAAAWCGLGVRQAGAALRWLLACGWLRRVGTHRRTALFMPATSPPRPCAS